jgi:vesicle-associated membrane protein 7
MYLILKIPEQFSPMLKQQIDTFNNNPAGADNISRVKAQIDSVKDVMVDNIDRVLERGEKIELLVDKTDRLNQQAFKFEKSSRALKTSMYCKKIKMYLLIFFVVGLVALFVSIMICGIDFKQC